MNVCKRKCWIHTKSLFEFQNPQLQLSKVHTKEMKQCIVVCTSISTHINVLEKLNRTPNLINFKLTDHCWWCPVSTLFPCRKRKPNPSLLLSLSLSLSALSLTQLLSLCHSCLLWAGCVCCCPPNLPLLFLSYGLWSSSSGLKIITTIPFRAGRGGWWRRGGRGQYFYVFKILIDWGTSLRGRKKALWVCECVPFVCVCRLA